MASSNSSISVCVRVRPFTIREAAQLTKTDDGTLFLGDGSLAAVPTPRFAQKGLRSVIKVVDDKCLYVLVAHNLRLYFANISTEFSTHLKKIKYNASQDLFFPRESESRIRRSCLIESSTTIPLRTTFTKPPQRTSLTAYLTDTMLQCLPMAQPDAARHIPSRTDISLLS